MMPLSLGELAVMAGGRLDGDAAATAIGVSVDTRTIQDGDVFVALHGERDGHDFVAEAVARGAVAAVVDRDAGEGIATIRVSDTLVALARLATAYRARLDVRAVAITGSSGKTCTKDFTAAVLAAGFRVVASASSFNNEIGVPLTVLEAGEDTDVIVAEIGARGIGHIRSLAPVVAHHVAVVTNVGVAHHGMFGSSEAIAIAKGEIVETVDPSGVSVLNADDPVVAGMASRSPANVLLYGGDGEVRATDVELDADARASFTLTMPGGEAAVTLPVPGEHMVSNALAAAAVGHWFGLGSTEIAGRLATVATADHRMRVFEAAAGFRVIDDAYNANPQSTAAALKALVRMGRGRRTVAVLGHMAELGSISEEEHDRIGRLATRLGVSRLITVGDDARAMHEAARLEGMAPEEAIFAHDVDSAAKTVLADVAAGDVVLVKASRAAGLERVVEAILE